MLGHVTQDLKERGHSRFLFLSPHCRALSEKVGKVFAFCCGSGGTGQLLDHPYPSPYSNVSLLYCNLQLLDTCTSTLTQWTR